MAHPQPTSRARRLVQGAVDLHVHAGPDIVPRRADAQHIVDRFTEHGLAGFVDKCHFAPTALKDVRTTPEGAQHFGAVVLNGFVGGLNPLAVEIAARAGARMVWLPTVDVEMTPEAAEQKLSGTPSSWSTVRDEIVRRGLARPMDPVTGEVGPSARLLSVLEVVRDNDLTLATGHLRFAETLTAVRAAADLGITRIVVTHPEFPAQQFTHDQQKVLAEAGGTLEYCYTTAASGKTSWDRWLQGIRAVPARNILLSSDAGQPASPPVEDCLALAADVLMEAGFTRDAVRTMAVGNSRRLLGLQ